MGRRQASRFRPGLDALETRQVLSANTSNPIMHTAIAPVAVPIATYNNTFTQISNAFYDYEAPADDVLNAIGSAASSLASAVLSSGSSLDASNDGSYVQDSKGDPNALEGRLQAALSLLPGGQTEANSLINRTFAYGGLNTDDASYFQAKLTSMVKKYATQEIKRGDMVLVWPGEAVPVHRS